MFPHHSDQTSQRFLFYQTLFFIDRFYQKYGKILVTVRPMFQGGEWGGDTLPIFGKVAHTDSHTLSLSRGWTVTIPKIIGGGPDLSS